MTAAERAEPFEMRSAQDMYEAFPAAVRASFPLYVRSAGPQVRGPISATYGRFLLACMQHTVRSLAHGGGAAGDHESNKGALSSPPMQHLGEWPCMLSGHACCAPTTMATAHSHIEGSQGLLLAMLLAAPDILH
jgi:hypothetical protein